MDETLTATIREAMPLAAHLGIEGVEADTEHVVLRGAWAPEHCTAAGILHGGYLMSLADMTAAMLAYLNVSRRRDDDDDRGEDELPRGRARVGR